MTLRPDPFTEIREALAVLGANYDPATARRASDALLRLEREAAERETALAHAEREANGRKLQMHEYRQENEFMKAERSRLAARVREVEAERDDARGNSARMFKRARTAEATVARQAETLRDVLSWVENYPLNADRRFEGDWTALCQAVRAVLASPEAAAAEPRARVCKGSTRHTRDCPCAKCRAAALPAVDAPELLQARLLRTNADRNQWRERAISAEQALGLYGPAVDAPPEPTT